jgi:hypothetical protein
MKQPTATGCAGRKLSGTAGLANFWHGHSRPRPAAQSFEGPPAAVEPGDVDRVDATDHRFAGGPAKRWSAKKRRASLAARGRALAAGVALPATELPLPATKLPLPATKVLLPATKVLLPATKVLLPATEVASPATKPPSPATKVPLPATDVPLPATDVPLPATDVPLPATDVPLPATEDPFVVSRPSPSTGCCWGETSMIAGRCGGDQGPTSDGSQVVSQGT